MFRWQKVFQYALALLAAQFLIGFLEGLLLPEGTGSPLSAQGIASSMVSLLLCAGVFAHLAVYQADRTLEHASLALLVQVTLGMLVLLSTPSWLAAVNAKEVGVELLVLLAALAAGTSLGNKLRTRHAASTEA